MKSKSTKNKAKKEEGLVIYTMSITTRNGRKIYRANGRPFRIVIKKANAA